MLTIKKVINAGVVLMTIFKFLALFRAGGPLFSGAPDFHAAASGASQYAKWWYLYLTRKFGIANNYFISVEIIPGAKLIKSAKKLLQRCPGHYASSFFVLHPFTVKILIKILSVGGNIKGLSDEIDKVKLLIDCIRDFAHKFQ